MSREGSVRRPARRLTAGTSETLEETVAIITAWLMPL